MDGALPLDPTREQDHPCVGLISTFLTYHSASCIPMHANFYTPPDPDGYVRHPEDCVLYWISPDYCTGLHSCVLLILSLTSHSQSIPFTLRTLLLDPLDLYSHFRRCTALVFHSSRPFASSLVYCWLLGLQSCHYTTTFVNVCFLCASSQQSRTMALHTSTIKYCLVTAI